MAREQRTLAVYAHKLRAAKDFCLHSKLVSSNGKEPICFSYNELPMGVHNLTIFMLDYDFELIQICKAYGYPVIHVKDWRF